MSVSLLAVTVALNACLAAGGARPGGGEASEPRTQKRVVKQRDAMLSCDGGELFFQDGHWYRLVRGAFVECDPSLPPSV